MDRILHISVMVVLFHFAFVQKATSEIVADWHFYDGTIALLTTTHPQSPALGRTTGIFVAYERSRSGCAPTVSLMSYNGLALGRVVAPRKQVSRSKKNQLVVGVGSRKFSAVGETVMNEYSNGTEIVAMFDIDLIAALRNPADVSISFGNSKPVLRIKTLNSISEHVEAARKYCTG
jgi:hypothetical protein